MFKRQMPQTMAVTPDMQNATSAAEQFALELNPVVVNPTIVNIHPPYIPVNAPTPFKMLDESKNPPYILKAENVVV